MRIDEQNDLRSQEDSWERYRLRAQGEALNSEGRAPNSVPYPSLGLNRDNNSGELLGNKTVDAEGFDSETANLDAGSGSKVSGLTNLAKRVARVLIPQRLRIFSVGEIAVVLISLIGLVAAALYLLQTNNASSVGVFSLVALVPLSGVVALLIWSDRMAPMRWRYLLLVALWGGGIATIVAGSVNTAFYSDFISIFGDVTRAESLAAVGVAPISEELLKGAGVVLVLLLGRKFVVSAGNGLVIGAICGAAFAYVENIQYFLQASSQGTSVLSMTIIARAILSPFVHPMATSFIGYFFASAMLRRGRAIGWIWRLGVGFGLAFAVHALWNGLASVGILWVVLYIVVEVPLFIAWLMWVMRQSRKQAPSIKNGLEPYLVTGWITGDEVQMVCDKHARKYALKWARKVGPDARKAVKNYLRQAGWLGLVQANMEKTGPEPERVGLARQALKEMLESRETYLHLGKLHAALSLR